MNSRTKGVLTSLHASDANSVIGSVEVLDGPLKGQTLPLFSVSEGPSPIPGLEVDFLICNFRKSGGIHRGAIDLRIAPTDLKQEIMAEEETVRTKLALALAATKQEKEQEKKKTTLLWETLRRVEAEEKRSGVGKGGPKHRYLQLFVKTVAEDLGWSATVEEQIEGGMKATDVVLKKSGYRIACEIAVSTVYVEYQNIQKNLEVGFDCVVSISTDTKAVATIRRMARQRLGVAAEKVHYILPEQLMEFLSEQSLEKRMARDESSFKLCHGYRVRVTYAKHNPAEIEERNHRVNSIIAQSILRKRMARKTG